MERKVTRQAAFTNAKARVLAEVKVNKEAAFQTVAAFVVCSIEGKHYHGVTNKADRQSIIKRTMIRADMSNGKAAAYSKVVEVLMTELVAKFGQPDGAELSPFWAAWRDAESVEVLERGVRQFMDNYAKADTLGQLCDACGVAYGSNKTAAKNKEALAKLRGKGTAQAKAKPAPQTKATTANTASQTSAKPAPEQQVTEDAPTKEQVLAMLLDLDPNDAAWVMDAYQAAAAHVAKDVTPATPAQIAA